MFELLKKRNFLALFIAQFLGAFNDNFFKTSLVSFVAFIAYPGLSSISAGLDKIIAGIAIGLFILPFFLFSANAGQLADKYSKSKLIKIIKFAEIIIMALGVWGFLQLTNLDYSLDLNFQVENKMQFIFYITFMLLVLFLMGLQSTFFGPLKYGILPEIVEKKDLIAANGLIEAATFVAILLGTISGGIVGSLANAFEILAVVLISVALFGFLVSLLFETLPAQTPNLKLDYNIIKALFKISKYAKVNRTILLCILGTSWFWLVGTVFMSQLPIYTKVNLLSDAQVYTFLLALFSLGIGLGSMLCHVLLKDEISSKFVPITAILMTVCIIDVVLGSGKTSEITATTDTELGSLFEFLSSFSGIRLSLDFFLLSLFGGLYVVPLQTMIQSASNITSRSRTIAANNILNSLFMVLGSAASTLILVAGLGIEHIFIVLALANTFVAIYICKLLPEHLLRSFFKTVLQFIYHIEVRGLENYKKLGKHTIIIANHVSFLDPILIAIFLPDKPMFAINTFIARNRLIKPFLRVIKAYPIDPTNPMATKSLVEQVRAGHKLVIFPEGRITTTGSLMKVYPGPSIIADKTGADILPICIGGAEYSLFSRFAKRIKKVPNAKIVLKILPPVKLEVADNLKGRKRRQALTDEMYKIMSTMKYRAENINQDLFESLINSAKRYGFNHKIVDDIERKPLSYRKLILGAFALGRVLEMFAGNEKYVGVMLPNTKATLLTLLGLIAHKKVPAMLNFTTGTNNLMQACLACQIETVFTSRVFIRFAKLEAFEDILLEAGKKIFYLEDLRHKISPLDKVVALFKTFFPDSSYKPAKADEPAVVLFTSGSEGTPKGVALSHKNIIANVNQIICRVDTSTNDKVLNTLPMFHSFGLTGGTFLPIYFGIQTFLYPSPLHYRIIPELAYDINATILFGTDTFLAGYAKIAHPYDFYSLRFAFAGAEKLREETHKLWIEKFGVRLFEGYGTTETSPIIAVNTPLYHKKGTVGQFVTGMQYRLEEVSGITDGFKLLVKGPNIMLGYFKVENPGVIEPIVDGWYDTGDIISIDDDGFITIKGRVKRFAKVAGEMVSLTAVENAISSLWSNFLHAIIAAPDEKKGEQLVLWTTNPTATREQILVHFKKLGLSELFIPKQINIISNLPHTGSGKIDYVTLANKILPPIS